MPPRRWLFMLLALIAYSLPWAVQPGAALTLNAYDLAEWTSLHPAVRAAPLPFALTFGLRAIPLLIYVAFIVDSSTRQWERALMAAIIAAALLPPFTFFAGGFGDPNHRQQLAISILVLAFGGISITKTLRYWRTTLQFAALLACAIVCVWSLIAGLDLMRGFNNMVQPGVGGLLLIVILMVFMVENIRGNLSQVTPCKRATLGSS